MGTITNAVVILISFAALCSASFAGLTGIDIAGRWEGTRTEYFNGISVTGTRVAIFRANPDGGFSGQSIISFPGIGQIRAAGRYYGAGALQSYEAQTYINGRLIANASGYWVSRGKSILVRATVQDVVTGTFTLIGRNRLAIVSSQTNSGRVSIILRRQ